MSQVQVAHFKTVEDFFLRALQPGARPLAAGVVSPADGLVVAAGVIPDDGMLWIKGKLISIERLFYGCHGVGLNLRGGWQATIFLTPDGYHHVHAPFASTLVDVRWIPGRFFPQNDAALLYIPRIYERNERTTLRLALADRRDALLSMVAASLVGGIHLDGVNRCSWMSGTPYKINRPLAKGERLGHFSFGSTVVLWLPPGIVTRTLVEPGQAVKVGQGLGIADGIQEM